MTEFREVAENAGRRGIWFYEFFRDLWRHGKAATSSSGFIENSATSEVAESAGRPVLKVNRSNLFFNFLSGPGRFCQLEYADHKYHRQKCPRAVCHEYVGLKVWISRAPLPIGTGSTQFESKFAGDTNLQIYISRSHIYSRLLFIVD